MIPSLASRLPGVHLGRTGGGDRWGGHKAASACWVRRGEGIVEPAAAATAGSLRVRRGSRGALGFRV